MPYISQDGNEILTALQPGTEGRGSNIVSGNMLLYEGYLYWCYYNSARNVQLLRWSTSSGEHPEMKTIEILANIGDNNKEHRYSEVGMFREGDAIYLSVRDEHSTNSNWRYDLHTKTMTHLANTKTEAFGPNIYKIEDGPAVLTGRQYTYLKKREQLTRMDNMILLSPQGEIIKENIGFVGHLMGGDSMYCSSVELNGVVFIFYYYGMNSSLVSPNSRYTLAYKTIKVEDLRKMAE